MTPSKKISEEKDVSAQVEQKTDAAVNSKKTAKSLGLCQKVSVENAKEGVKHCFAPLVKHPIASALCILLALGAYGLYSAQQEAIKALDAKVTLLTKGEEAKETVRTKIESVVNTPRKDVTSNQKSYDEQISKAIAQMPGIDKVVEMDVKKLRAFRDKEGRVLYMLDNGRFVLVGDIIDVWAKKKLDTLEDLEKAFNRVDLKGLGLEVSKTNHITWGEGEKHVTVVVDPFCGWCHRLVQEIRADRKLAQEYTFDFILVGFLGKKSQDAVRTLACSNAPAEAKLNAFMGGEKALNNLIKAPDCDESKLRESQMAVTALGVQSVPYIIAPDGRFNRGKPRDIRAFLEGKTQPSAPVTTAPERPKVDATPLKSAKRSDLNILTAGTGKKTVTVFVDPHCGWCHKSIEEIMGDKELLANFKFDFVATSILGPSSERLNKMIACAKPGTNTLEAFRGGEKGIEALKVSESCEQTKTATTDALRKAMNIRSVPIFVTDDGRVQTGKPSSIRSFLGLNKK